MFLSNKDIFPTETIFHSPKWKKYAFQNSTLPAFVKTEVGRRFVVNSACYQFLVFLFTMISWSWTRCMRTFQGVEHDLWRIARIEQMAKISVYKQWRHFCSREQNYSGQILYSRMNFQRDIRQVSILRFPLNFNSEAVSWYSNFPPGDRMKSSIYVKRKAFEVHEFSVSSFVSITFC